MVKKIFIGIFFLLVAACSLLSNDSYNASIKTNHERIATSQSTFVELPGLGLAPELENDIWINTDVPLRLSNLEGKVVLLEMWTFG